MKCSSDYISEFLLVRNPLMALALASSRPHFLTMVAWAEVARCRGDSKAEASRSAVPNPTPGSVCEVETRERMKS